MWNNIIKRLNFPALKTKDNVEIIVKNSAGEIKEKKTYRNIITNVGRAAMASRLNGDGAEAVFNYIAIGEGSNAATVTDTALQTETVVDGGQRKIATLSRVTTTVNNDTAQWVAVFTFTLAHNITESGILNAASAGTLLARRVFGTISCLSGDSMQITWKIQLT